MTTRRPARRRPWRPVGAWATEPRGRPRFLDLESARRFANGAGLRSITLFWVPGAPADLLRRRRHTVDWSRMVSRSRA